MAAPPAPEPVIRIDVPEELSGPRVLLRPLALGDAPAVWEAIEESRAHLAPWIPWVHKERSLDDERAAIVSMRERWLRNHPVTYSQTARSMGT